MNILGRIAVELTMTAATVVVTIAAIKYAPVIIDKVEKAYAKHKEAKNV